MPQKLNILTGYICMRLNCAHCLLVYVLAVGSPALNLVYFQVAATTRSATSIRTHIFLSTMYTHKCMYVFICIHMYVYIFFIYLNCGPMCRLLFMLLPKVCSVLACRKFKLLGLSWLYIISKSKKKKNKIK